MPFVKTIAAALAISLGGGGALAETAAPSVPTAMPFDIPYGAPIGLEPARRLVDAGIGEAKKRNWKMNIAVVDPHGDLVAFARMDDAQFASVEISQRKARTAARFRRETRVFAEAVAKGHPEVTTLGPDSIAIAGGVPIIADGHLVGAIGCSGGASDQDAVVCKAALESQK